MDTLENTTESTTTDIFGISFSILCAIHCLLTPFLMAYAPRLGHQFESPWFHGILIVLVSWALYQSIFLNYKIRGSKLILGLGLTGYLILIINFLIEVFGHDHHNHDSNHHHAISEVHADETLMIIFSLIGGIFLVSAHILNYLECRKKCKTN